MKRGDVSQSGDSWLKTSLLFFLILTACFVLAGCRRTIETVIITAEPYVEETPEPTPVPPTEAPVDPKISTPPQFQSLETFPPESNQLINPKKATYERLNVNREEKKAAEEEVAQGKTLPVISVTTNNNEEYILSRSIYTSCVIDVFNCPEEWILDEVSAGIRVRGNSSGFYGDVEKIKSNPVPYRIKFDKKTNMLGLHNGAKSKSWVLLKAGYDMIRNDLAFRFGRAIIGDHTFCSDATLVHLYVNDVYQGIYTLCEQCQTGENRVNITEPKEGYTGIDIGYYLVIDNNPEYPSSFRVDYGKHRVTDIEGYSRVFLETAYTIKSDFYTQGQVDFICQYINNVFEIVYQACEKNSYLALDSDFNLTKAPYDNAQETVEAVMDIESVVDMYLLYEIMHDYDVGEGSFYMCVDFGENSTTRKLQFTSPWDFNWTCEGRTDRYWAGSFCELSFIGKNGDRTNPWFVVLIKQDWFQNLVSQKWTELANNKAISNCIDEELDILEMHKKDLNTARSSSVSGAMNVLVWINSRIKWMDTQFLLGQSQ